MNLYHFNLPYYNETLTAHLRRVFGENFVRAVQAGSVKYLTVRTSLEALKKMPQTNLTKDFIRQIEEDDMYVHPETGYLDEWVKCC